MANDDEAAVTIEMEKAVELGWAKRHVGTDGAVRYSLTELGRQHIEKLLTEKGD